MRQKILLLIDHASRRKARERAGVAERRDQALRLRFRALHHRTQRVLHRLRGDEVVSRARAPRRRFQVWQRDRRLGSRVYLRRDGHRPAAFSWRQRR